MTDPQPSTAPRSPEQGQGGTRVPPDTARLAERRTAWPAYHPPAWPAYDPDAHHEVVTLWTWAGNVANARCACGASHDGTPQSASRWADTHAEEAR